MHCSLCLERSSMLQVELGLLDAMCPEPVTLQRPQQHLAC